MGKTFLEGFSGVLITDGYSGYNKVQGTERAACWAHINLYPHIVCLFKVFYSPKSVYLYMPTCAYQIGPVTVNRNGSITCDDEAMIDTIRPMLIGRGWLDAEQETEKTPADSEATASVRVMKLTMPLEGWTVSQMTNLLRMLYSKQKLINRMLDDSLLFIDKSFFTMVSWNPPVTPADFEAQVQSGVEAGYIEGMSIADGKVILSVPFAESESIRRKAYSDLLCGILRTAAAAKRIYLKQNDDLENEKYHANSWLMRMGFGGTDFKKTRRILMRHLKGYAAFRSAADMEAHRERQAQRRLEIRKEDAHD